MWQNILWDQRDTRRYRLSQLTNRAPRIWAQMRWGGGEAAGSQPMRTAVHITRHGAQCKFWRSNSIFNLYLGSNHEVTQVAAHLRARRVWTRPRAAETPYASSQPSCCPLHAPRTERAREARPTSAGTRWRWWGAWSRTCRRVSLHLHTVVRKAGVGRGVSPVIVWSFLHVKEQSVSNRVSKSNTIWTHCFPKTLATRMYFRI